MKSKKQLKIKQRQGQRVRIARAIKDLRSIKTSQNQKDAILSLRGIATNYKKIKGVNYES